MQNRIVTEDVSFVVHVDFLRKVVMALALPSYFPEN